MRRFIQIEEYLFLEAIRAIARERGVAPLLEQHSGYLTSWHRDGELVAKRYRYKHSSQCLIAIQYAPAIRVLAA